jgi:ribonuclease HI
LFAFSLALLLALVPCFVSHGCVSFFTHAHTHTGMAVEAGNAHWKKGHSGVKTGCIFSDCKGVCDTLALGSTTKPKKNYDLVMAVRGLLADSPIVWTITWVPGHAKVRDSITQHTKRTTYRTRQNETNYNAQKCKSLCHQVSDNERADEIAKQGALRCQQAPYGLINVEIAIAQRHFLPT